MSEVSAETAGDELATLLGVNGAREIAAGGSLVTVKPLTIGQMPRVLQLLRAPILAVLQERNEIDVMVEHGADIIQGVAVATGIPLAVVESWSQEEFNNVLEAIIDINRSFFPNAGDAGGAASWADVFQTLIGAGHSASGIAGYTVAQALLYLSAIGRARKQQLVEQMAAVRIAMHADDKHFREAIDDRP